MKYPISITKTTAPAAKPADESKLGFGRIFTDHMFLMDYDRCRCIRPARRCTTARRFSRA